MAGTTPRFGFNWFDGGSQPGSLADDGQKFSGADRQLLDQLLSAIENHDHAIPPSGSFVPEEPTLSYSPTGGSLSAGTTLYYRVAFVDADGLETKASPEASVVLPDKLSAPAAPGAETSAGGTLGIGLYYYALTAIRGSEESTLGDPMPATVRSGEGTVTLTLPALGSATSYAVWRMGDADGQWRRFSSTTSSTTFVDDGTTVPAVLTPPTTNTGVATYSVEVALSATDAGQVDQTHGWRIYQSTTSGTYGGNSLVHEVTERVDDLDPGSARLSAWTDTGDALAAGSPVNIGRQLGFTNLRIPIYDTLPVDVSRLVDGSPAIVADELYALRSGEWVKITSSGSPVVTGSAPVTGDMLMTSSGIVGTVDIEDTELVGKEFTFVAHAGASYLVVADYGLYVDSADVWLSIKLREDGLLGVIADSQELSVPPDGVSLWRNTLRAIWTAPSDGEKTFVLSAVRISGANTGFFATDSIPILMHALPGKLG